MKRNINFLRFCECPYSAKFLYWSNEILSRKLKIEGKVKIFMFTVFFKLECSLITSKCMISTACDLYFKALEKFMSYELTVEGRLSPKTQ